MEDVFKWALYLIAFACLALIGAMDWKEDGLIGHAFTVFSVIAASIALVIAAVEASQV